MRTIKGPLNTLPSTHSTPIHCTRVLLKTTPSNPMLLTLQPRIQHIQCHLITLLGPCDRHQALIAIILRLIDLNYTSAEMTDLVDLRPSFPNDRSDHVIGDIDLLGEGLARHGARHRLRLLTMGTTGLLGVGAVGAGLRTTSSTAIGWARGASVWHGAVLGVRLLWVLIILASVGVGGCARWLGWVTSVVGIWVAVLPACRLGNIRDDLHAAWNDARRTSTSRCIGRSSRTTEAFGKLLN